MVFITTKTAPAYGKICFFYQTPIPIYAPRIDFFYLYIYHTFRPTVSIPDGASSMFGTFSKHLELANPRLWLFFLGNQEE